MKMNRTLSIIFNILYAITIFNIWYVGFALFRIRGIYRGDLPEKGRELLDFYATHPLHGLMNMFATCLAMPAGTIFCLLGMGKDLQSQSLWINLINISNVICGNCFMFNAMEWINSERSY
ncbi:hypothetical protein RDWZM_004613 [Blomia tropicalis]|uniref:Uncharacterized protein n=1 Tax=Blomia tropicalis TaxID=40697 RepID=A0A9Q0RMR5_BLOTA|nr:hypothetical protein BLOT_016229 [Blomia tropicalis]KAJ6218801.1 hypothetical protein RDWZM_004613 [Blomia tropicalis]